MLSISATIETIEFVRNALKSEDRLGELVSIHNANQHSSTLEKLALLVDGEGIHLPIDWYNQRPPYLFSSPLLYDKPVLLGLIFHLLGNDEKAWDLLKDYPALRQDVGIVNRLQYGYQIQLSELTDSEAEGKFEQYRQQHNNAIVQNYGYLDQQPSMEKIGESYQKAIALAPNDEYKAFSTKYFATYLLDLNQLTEANAVLDESFDLPLSEAARFALKAVQANVWMKQLTVPYDQNLLTQLKNTIWETLQYFEQNDRKAEAGLLLLDAAHIANISNSFSEALGYVTKAIRFFEAEELHELAGNAQLRKGTLLYTWAQNGNPQFFKPAIESYQAALKVFTKAAAPDVFADIHHNLAVIYTDMPAENTKKSIWAGVAVSSFTEALEFYTKAAYPYEYGMICNNYGNAFTKFPQAVLTDNFEKALFYYQEALDVRPPSQPYERAMTLLNFLEASWKVGNDIETFNEHRYKDMVTKAQEVKTLVNDNNLLAEATKHLELLAKLKEAVS